MKLLSLILTIIGIGCSQREKPEIPQTYMPDPTLKQDIRTLGPNSVVFLGDSLTHIGWWRKWYPDVETSNQGWGGDKTFNVLARLTEVIEAKPKKIFLLIGGNDICGGTPHPLMTELHRKIVSRIVKETPSTKLYVQAVMPFGRKIRYYFGDHCPETYQQDILAVNRALKVVCLMYGVKYLDTYGLMADESGHFKPEYTIDQLHLSELGYEVWVAFLRPHVYE